MREGPQPPFLVIREGLAFWIQKTPAHQASATLQAVHEGCFQRAFCYDATGGSWPILNATIDEPSSLLDRTLPWRQHPVRLDLGPRTEVTVEAIVSQLARVLRDDNEFCELSEAPAEALARFRRARTPSDLIQVALHYEQGAT